MLDIRWERKFMLCLRLLAALILTLVLLAGQRSEASPATFKEAIFANLRWGMPLTEFSKGYIREVYKARSGYFADPAAQLYGQSAIVGFDFGETNHLRRIIGSFLFDSYGKRLGRDDVLRESNRILSEIKGAYSQPDLGIPWDGKTFVHIWVRSADVIQFAWNGSDAWGLHYRSRVFDSEVPGILDYLKSLGVKVK